MSNRSFSMIPQLRITVNSRCQKACFYCRPSGEGSIQSPEYEMSTDEILMVVREIVRYGITDIKLTGGDPILKSDIVSLVRQIKEISGVKSIHLVTRHALAGLLADDLAKAGLDCLNFSLDTLSPSIYKAVTGVSGHDALLDAIRKSVPVSRSVKINTVIMASINDHELFDLVQFAEESQVDTLKFLDLIMDMDEMGDEEPSFRSRLQTISPGKSFNDLYFPLDKFAEQLRQRAITYDISRQPGGLGHPMMTYQLPSGLKVQIKDARRGAWYSDVCKNCPIYPCHDAIMSLRLTTEGKLQRCLARSDNLLDILTPIRQNDESVVHRVIEQALQTFKQAEFDALPQMMVQKLHPLLNNSD